MSVVCVYIYLYIKSDVPNILEFWEGGAESVANAMEQLSEADNKKAFLYAYLRAKTKCVVCGLMRSYLFKTLF